MPYVDLTLHSGGHCRERAWFVDRARGFGKITLPALVAALRHPQAGLLLFDTGYGPHLAHSRSFPARLYRRLLPFTLAADPLPTDGLSAIIVSHFHPDHIGGLRSLPAVPLYHSREGLAQLRALSAYQQARHAFLPELLPPTFPSRAIEDCPRVTPPNLAPFTEAYDLLHDGSLLAVPLPGHALGQHGLLCRHRDGSETFLVADAAWVLTNITELSLPAEPALRLLGHRPTIIETLRKLHALHRRRPDLPLLPSHA
jgi:glyoxylase-like metal-dependent hydrolase (beta-lactamase superfamily II)